MNVALQCKRCGGSLPTPGGGSPFVTCSFCGTSHAVSIAPALSLHAGANHPSSSELRANAMNLAWDAARANSKDPVVALRALVAECAHELTTELELERAARLAEALATNFDDENKTHIVNDKMAAIRIAEVAAKAIIELRRLAKFDLNLPFLLVGDRGPLHLRIEVTQAKLIELDAMGSYVVREAVASPTTAPVTPRRRWWPFK